VLRRVGGDAHLAQEVTQGVFADLARKAGPLSRRDSVVGWLFVAARFAAAKAVRRDRQHQDLVRKAFVMAEIAGNAGPDWEELRPVLDEAIQRLDERDREAILLHFYGQRTYRDIGAALRLTENGARMRVERALEKLRRMLVRRGIASTAAALAVILGSQAAAAIPAGLAATVTTGAMSTAALSASGAVTLALMTITKTQLVAALAVVAAGAAFLGVSQQSEIASLRRELHSSVAESGQRTRELQDKLTASASTVASLRVQVKALKAGSAQGGKSGSKGAESDTFKVVHMKDVIRDHPEYAELEDREIRHSVMRRYATAIAALDLPADQEIRLRQLLVEKEISAADARRAADQAGVSPDDLNKAMNAATKDADQSIVALIGAGGKDRLEALQDNGNFNSVNDLTADMAGSGMAASAEQANALALMLYDAGKADKTPAASNPDYRTVDSSTWLSPLDQQFLTQAATVLTPAQVAILKTFRSEENHRQAIMKEYLGNSGGMITD